MLNSPTLPVRHSLKRSASTASLPTPPRTRRRHAKNRSRGSFDSDSSDDDDGTTKTLASDNDKKHGTTASNKKRRIHVSNAPDDDEDAFWLTDSVGTKGPALPTVSAKQPLLYQRRERTAVLNSAPVSPPPSHRRSARIAAMTPSPAAASSPPSTPKPRRDSPNNPFLVSSSPHSASPETPNEIANDKVSPTPKRHEEPPTVTYVFRGVRRVYQNPLYNPVTKRAISPPPGASLPIEHPDYSPPVHFPPRLLFPGRGSKGNKKGISKGVGGNKSPLAKRTIAKHGTIRRSRGSVSDSDSDAVDLEALKPRKLDFHDLKDPVEETGEDWDKPENNSGKLAAHCVEKRDTLEDELRRAVGPQKS